jgi:phosphate starvation-inducible PhoH-like protein|tara:strand:+ start:1448 stop:2410 length:963 start_codon:yes stop_codon:yes gene_type:complete
MSDLINKVDNLEIELDDNTILSNLFGVNDSNLQIIEKINDVSIQYRGNKIKISGNKKSIFETKKTILDLFKEAKKGAEIDEDKIRDSTSLITMNIKEEKQMDLFIQTKKRKIVPRTENQNIYFKLLNSKNIVFAVGPAGTGKTYIAVAKAVSALQEGRVNKIILSRPAVEAGEKLGFLPGDLKEKVDPFLRPIYDALYSMLPFEQVEKKILNNTIEIAPIAFMRGRTLEDCFIILDEAQNTTRTQMKMFLTRLGKNSQMVVVGDVTQIDLVSEKESGLMDALKKLKKINDIGFIELVEKDVVRHDLVKKIINAYDKDSKS